MPSPQLSYIFSSVPKLRCGGFRGTKCLRDFVKQRMFVSKCKCPVFVAREMSGFVFSSSRRRSCWKVGIPRCLRDFQARWKSRHLDFSTERLFNSLLCCRLRDRCALAGVAF